MTDKYRLVLKGPAVSSEEAEYIRKIATAAPALRDALLDLHRYNQTDPAYLGSPAAKKAHDALVRAGAIDENGNLIEEG
jgi:hypothetical protein